MKIKVPFVVSVLLLWACVGRSETMTEEPGIDDALGDKADDICKSVLELESPKPDEQILIVLCDNRAHAKANRQVNTQVRNKIIVSQDPEASIITEQIEVFSADDLKVLAETDEAIKAGLSGRAAVICKEGGNHNQLLYCKDFKKKWCRILMYRRNHSHISTKEGDLRTTIRLSCRDPM